LPAAQHGIEHLERGAAGAKAFNAWHGGRKTPF
jgi:hypothetical protein